MTATSAFRGFDRLRRPGAIGAIVALAVGLLVPASHGAGADWSTPTQPTRDERAAGGMFEAAGDVAPLDSFPSDDPVGGPTESSSRSVPSTRVGPFYDVVTTVDNFASPAGYLDLTLFSPTDVGATDESIMNFTVPTFDFAGQSYDTIGIVSNGYVVVGGGNQTDVASVNSDLPDATPPDNILAPFWTDLDPSAGGTVWVELLTDGFDSWTVVEWQDVPNSVDGELNTAQVWIGNNTDSDPTQDISFTYATPVSDGDGGLLTVGAENKYGTHGDTTYFNGAGTPPAPSLGGGSDACDTAWPGPPCYEVDVSSTLIPDIAVGLGPYPTEGGWVEHMMSAAPFATSRWSNTAWPAYNDANGATRPAVCDVNGDLLEDLVVGLDSFPAAGGWVSVQLNNGVLHWLHVPWSAYNAANGETFPACGDIDDDGRDEIVIGLGTYTPDGGWVYVVDDLTTGFAPMPTSSDDGWLYMSWPAYNAVNGAVHPAVGNVDDDPAEEVVLGVGTGGGGWALILDDADANGARFAPLANTPVTGGWVQVTWPVYNATNGEIWPAVCNLDGGGGHLVFGLGVGGAGWLQVLNSDAGFAPAAGTPSAGGWFQVPWPNYNTAVGSTYPACGNTDLDVHDEVVVGLGTFGPGGGGWLALFDDLSATMALVDWPRVNWPDYNAANGSTRPSMR